jgi:anti-sigma factor RsiW
MVVEHPVQSEELMELLDGELPFDRAAVVQAHVAGCARCQDVTGQLRGVSHDLSRWKLGSAPSSVKDPQPLSATRRAQARFASWMLHRAFAVAAGLVLVAGAIVVQLTTLSFKSVATSVAVEGTKDVPETAPAATERGERVLAIRGSGSVAAPITTPPPFGGVAALSKSAPQPVGQQATIARTGSLRLRAIDIDVARAAVDRVIIDTGTVTSSLSVSGPDGGRSLTAALMIPGPRFDAALTAFKAIGRVVEETQGGEDVREQMLDVDARLKNARNTEARLIELLRTRTGDLSDVLAAEREVARVREEIERFDASRRNLADRVAHVHFNLNIVEERQPQVSLGPRPVTGRIRDAFVDGVTLTIESTLAVALAVVSAAPLVLTWSVILGVPFWIFRLRMSRAKQ